MEVYETSLALVLDRMVRLKLSRKLRELFRQRGYDNFGKHFEAQVK